MCFAQKDEFITISKDAKHTHTQQVHKKKKMCTSTSPNEQSEHEQKLFNKTPIEP